MEVVSQNNWIVLAHWHARLAEKICKLICPAKNNRANYLRWCRRFAKNRETKRGTLTVEGKTVLKIFRSNFFLILWVISFYSLNLSLRFICPKRKAKYPPLLLCACLPRNLLYTPPHKYIVWLMTFPSPCQLSAGLSLGRKSYWLIHF